MKERNVRVFSFLLLILPAVFATPVDPDLSSLVVSSPSGSGSNLPQLDRSNQLRPKIDKLEITSSIRNRYSSTTVVSEVKNVAKVSLETKFAVVLPETAFVTGFTMEIKGENYTALVKEKEKAYNIYKEAVEKGIAAGHVSTRDSSHFIISVNIEPEGKAVFYLQYEELLKRKNGRYEQVINIYPGQLVNDIKATVAIDESRKIINLKAPPIRSGNELENDNAELDPRADIESVSETMKIVRFSPNLERQKQVAHILGTDEGAGFAGQFVVQYDVERDSSGGDILLQDGYFVHFFSPSGLKHVPRHVIFVLDTSASMAGQKIEQLREAMLKILEELHEDDLFSIILFGSYIRVLDINNLESSTVYPTIAKGIQSYCAFALSDQHYDSLHYYKFPTAFPANKENIEKAKSVVKELAAYGGTDILSALNVGLHLAKLERQHATDKSVHPIMIFLSDGAPTVRKLDTRTIATEITNDNLHETLIFTLSFGDEADKKFLKKLALDNSGFSRHIYEAADASLQLQDFYKQISSPLLFNVQFKYVPEIDAETNFVSKADFYAYFDGSEHVVTGRADNEAIKMATVNGIGSQGNVSFQPTFHHSASNVERIWAYLTIHQLLEKEDALYNNELRQKIVDIALKYSFVTPVTSLIVTKPDATNTTNFYNDIDERETYTTTSAPPVRTTPFCRELIYPVSVHSSLKNVLPWIADVNTDGIIKLPQGEYKLGFNETNNENLDCPKTPFNSPGKCRLLHSCPSVFAALPTFDDFVNHSCLLKDGFLGVCCTELDS